MSVIPVLERQTPCTQKHDRLGWIAGRTWRLLDLRIGMRAGPDPATAEAVLDRMAACMPARAVPSQDAEADMVLSVLAPRNRPDSHVRRHTISYFAAMPLYRGDSLDDALEVMAHWTEVMAGLVSRGHVFVHAGAVEVGGRAVIVPGRSRAGKSTLTAALLSAGAGYLSDEYAVVDGEGMVHPFPRPLQIRSSRCRTREPGETCRRVDAGEYGARAATGPVPAGLVVRSVYHPSAEWTPRSMSASETLVTLMRNTLWVRNRPADAAAYLGAVAERAGGLAGLRGDAGKAAADIVARLRTGAV